VVKKFEEMYNRLDRLPGCDRQTDGRTYRQTSCHGLVRAMHTRPAVKITIFLPVSHFDSEMMQDRAIVTMEGK